MDLGRLLGTLQETDNPDLLVGFGTSDDAGVYRVGEELALVQTVDLITPVCDDPYLFGQVAAANALSDVYAMGGRPLTALNICCFPATGVPEGIYEEILRGGRDKAREAEATVVGGHTVRDPELKYGMAVTGTIHPSAILRNSSARPGDLLALTKPIGTGILVGAARKDLVEPRRLEIVLRFMARLNRSAAELALRHGAHAATDITGFGLAGHALEMARGSGAALRLSHAAIPFHQEALTLMARGEGAPAAMIASNQALAGRDVRFDAGLDEASRRLHFDPQTSGGLLVSLPAREAEAYVAEARRAGDEAAAVVGEVLGPRDPLLEVTA